MGTILQGCGSRRAWGATYPGEAGASTVTLDAGHTRTLRLIHRIRLIR